MLARVVIVIAMLGLLNGYAAWRLIARWPLAEQHSGIAWLLAFAFFLVQLAGPFGERLLFRKAHRARSGVLLLAWASYLAFGVLSFLVVYNMVADVIEVAWELIVRPTSPLEFDQTALVVLATLSVGTLVIGVRQALAGPAVRAVDIPLANLPAAFDGFRIAQVSDLHVGPIIGRSYTRNVVNIVNGLKPDVIALTGDLVDGTIEHLTDGVAPLGDLRADHGIFFVTGNHEYFWDAVAWSLHFSRLGARVLANEHQVIARGEAAIILAGITDYSTLGTGPATESNPGKALSGAPPDLCKMVLAHQPASYRMTHAAGFDLQISGHTHGGQYFPFSFLIRYFQRYYKGLNRHEKMWVYVNCGTGYWGPPLRAGVPAEITLITLRHASVTSGRGA
jgi:predicted MPP superfamily phosphohydrolase